MDEADIEVMLSITLGQHGYNEGLLRVLCDKKISKFKKTILWRDGPPEKPVLCNSCGSRWRVKRTLDGSIPRHANREIQSYQLPSEMKPARDDQKLEVGVQDCSSACLEEEMNNISSLGSAGSSSDNCMQMEEINGEADKDPLWNPDSVPKRKRSELRQRILKDSRGNFITLYMNQT